MNAKFLKLRSHIEEVVSLTDEEWKVISQSFEYRSLKKHQFLIQQGGSVDCEFWIIEGLVKAYFIDEKGKEHILQFAMENYWVSDHYAFQYDLPADLNLDCLENSEFFCLSKENRERMCFQFSKMANFFRIKGHYGYVNLQERILSFLTQTAEERYERLLDRKPELIQRVPKKLLAAYLGVSRETLSRLKA